MHDTERKPKPRKKTRRAKNTNRQGADFELAVMHDLEPHGYNALRSSGSRGAIDVVAVGPARGHGNWLWTEALVFIQCKISNPLISPDERAAVTGMAERAGAVPVVAYKVDGRIEYRRLTGAGPKDWVCWFPLSCQCQNPDCTANKRLKEVNA